MNRKDEILEAVINVFQQEGFSTDLKLSQIAEKVNIGKSTIYEYFKTKDEIYKEAILKIIQTHIDQSLDIGNIDEMTFEVAFKTQVEKLYRIAAKSRMMMEVFTKNFVKKLPETIKLNLQKKMELAQQQINKRFIDIFMKGLSEGLFPDVRSEIKRELATSLIVGGLVRYSDKSTNLDLQEFVNQIYKYTILIGQE
jgi:AcrR family transcriptional regulator